MVIRIVYPSSAHALLKSVPIASESLSVTNILIIIYILNFA